MLRKEALACTIPPFQDLTSKDYTFSSLQVHRPTLHPGLSLVVNARSHGSPTSLTRQRHPGLCVYW